MEPVPARHDQGDPVELGQAVTHHQPRRGLSEAEAAHRLAARAPFKPPSASRSYASIVAGNVFTVFNAILAVFGALTLAFGDWRDALFLGVLVVNTTIGVTQEARAKRALDRLAALVTPTARVIRAGTERDLEIAGVVAGDLVRLQSGDQVVADGHVVQDVGLMLDESILTGESHAVARTDGEAVRSGSFAVEGTGLYEVEAVGPESYAERLAADARVYERLRSPLERAFNRLLMMLVAVMLPLAAILGYSLWARETPTEEAVTTATAAVVSLVPEGLILLMSLTFAVGALRMTRRGALVQRLNSIESIASADVVCFDKTGTLTESGLALVDLLPAAHADPQTVGVLLGRYAASTTSPNETVRALARARPAEPEAPVMEIPFSSRRRWSAMQLGAIGYVLGAPELFALDGLGERVAAEQRAGRRVVAFGRAQGALDPNHDPTSDAPPRTELLGVAVLTEPLRPETRETVGYFLDQGVQLKVFSGDNPATVAAIAEDAGMKLTGPPVDASHIGEDSPQLRRMAVEATVIGRLSPSQKSACVRALRDAGRFVVMVGDGVNDVPALKAARLAIAQGSGVQMAKSVADVVLVQGGFDAVPPMVKEGRQILRNLQRVAKLYVSKSVFAAFLILTIGTTATAYPLLPRHFSLAATLTIGIPTFFLALAPSSGAWRPTAFLRELGRFAVPAGVGAGVAVVASYQFALNALELSLRESRTVAATALVLVGLSLVLALEGSARRRRTPVALLCGGLAMLFGLALALPASRTFFELAVPSAPILLTAILGSAIAVAGLLASGFPPAPASGGSDDLDRKEKT